MSKTHRHPISITTPASKLSIKNAFQSSSTSQRCRFRTVGRHRDRSLMDSRSRSPRYRQHDNRHSSRSSPSPSRSPQSRHRTRSISQNRRDASTGLVPSTAFDLGCSAYPIATKNMNAIVALSDRVARIEDSVHGAIAPPRRSRSPTLHQRLNAVEEIIDVLVAERENDPIEALNNRIARVEDAVTELVEMIRVFAGMKQMKRSLAAVAGITASFSGRRNAIVVTPPDRPIKRE
ncbi:MAG: hypothetical protein Q9207_004709 [Kuettlingeria erythrocarpa]